jgi:hypothetical protein
VDAFPKTSMSQKTEMPASGVLHRFELEFRDEGPKRLTLEYSQAHDETLRSVQRDSTCRVITLNPSGCVALAKILLKLGLGSYPNGYRVALRSDFDGNELDSVIIELDRSSAMETEE